ncbi:MAG: P-loop ATPase, Sll1717 family [Mycobacteriales bacterium]
MEGRLMARSAGKNVPHKKLLDKLHLGQSFAEYDTLLANPAVFVRTQALNAAVDPDNPHCFFVGRRGTGKTAITRFMQTSSPNVLIIRPEIFSPSSGLLGLDAFKDANQRPFRSLMASFRRTLEDEALFAWSSKHAARAGWSNLLVDEVDQYGDFDFDLRSLAFIEELTSHLVESRDADWVRAIKIPKTIASDMIKLWDNPRAPFTLLIDAIDESWDGSELAVIYLAAMMHACVEINSYGEGIRVLMFLRENIFERVRLMDTEFARLETCVVGLDWSDEQLLEMVERRLNAGLISKFGLGGPTWDKFFAGGQAARRVVFDFCQSRPRDVLTYCALALDTAQSHKHDQIQDSDLHDARRRFSDSRLKDLGDEYQENYPQLALVLGRFYGLGRRWTLSGISAFLERILADHEITGACATWIYRNSAPEQFVRLLYDIGFFGLLIPRGGGEPRVVFRSLGPRDTTPPPIDNRTDISVHPSYWEALDLLDVLVTEFGSDNEFGTRGMVSDFPGALDLVQYRASLEELNDALKTLPFGNESAHLFESLVGSVLELCFFRVLFNLEPQVRDVSGTVRRDWVASNRGEAGFWEMVRHRYGATQVLFECKNYEELTASDFHQTGYYMSGQAGRLVIIVFRGEVRNHYFEHVKKLSGQGGLVLMLNDRDLRVFVRQAINGKVKDSHLQDKHDRVVRAIS